MHLHAPIHRLGAAVLRVVVGIIFLWAGLEKAVGAGLGTWSAEGFLKFGTTGTLGWPFVSGEPAEGTVFNPTHGFWVALANDPTALTIIDYLVPLGQIGIGISLVLGLLTRFGAAMGTLMMAFFFVAAWEFQFGIVNQHLTYAVVLLTIAGLGAGRYYGLDAIVGPLVPRWAREWLMSGEPDIETGGEPALALARAVRP